MTLFGKLLAILNLVFGIGMAIGGTLVYTQRPTWFEPPPEGAIDKGNTPVTFKGLTADIDALGKKAAVATQNWGAALKSLKEKEKTRIERKTEYDRRIQVGWQGPVPPGSPQDLRAKGPAFFIDIIDDRTGLIDTTQQLTNKSGRLIPFLGPGHDGKGNNLPLEGADTILDAHHREVELVVGDGNMKKGLIQQIKALREEQVRLQAEIVRAETRVHKQFQIREDVQLQVIYLKDFRITVGSNQETVYARKKQLEERLKQILPPPKRN